LKTSPNPVSHETSYLTPTIRVLASQLCWQRYLPFGAAVGQFSKISFNHPGVPDGKELVVSGSGYLAISDKSSNTGANSRINTNFRHYPLCRLCLWKP